MQFIDLASVKQQLRVTHTASDAHIQSLLDESKQVASDYLNKTLFEDQAIMDASIADLNNDITAERALLVNHAVNGAIALLVEHRFYGVTGFDADKFKNRALDLLQPHRYLVGW